MLNFLDKLALVVVPIIPPHAGEVQVQFEGGTCNCIAYTTSKTAEVIHTGTLVKILAVQPPRTVFVGDYV